MTRHLAISCSTHSLLMTTIVIIMDNEATVPIGYRRELHLACWCRRGSLMLCGTECSCNAFECGTTGSDLYPGEPQDPDTQSGAPSGTMVVVRLKRDQFMCDPFNVSTAIRSNTVSFSPRSFFISL